MNKLKFLTFLCLLCCEGCFAERYIKQTLYPDQEELLQKGGAMILSEKENCVVMYQTSPTVKYNKANFYFLIENHCGKRFNFYQTNLRVTDQYGRRVKVVSKDEILDQKRSERNWNLFFSGLQSVCDYMEADRAGEVNSYSTSYEKSRSKYDNYGSRGWSKGSSSYERIKVKNETLHVEGLRRQAIRDAEIDAHVRNTSIQASYDKAVHNFDEFYFDSTTVFPESSYAANVQIALNQTQEKELEYLLFTFDLDGEEHTFCFYCGLEKGRRRHR